MTPEGAVLDAVLDLLAAEHVTAWRMNTGAVKVETRFIQFGVPGFSDILAIPTVRGKFKGFRARGPCRCLSRSSLQPAGRAQSRRVSSGK